ncbi:hypothetical protein SNOG_04361 [Parastagonospora nodorum SN15]|uniref:Uncharacterized protein n=1 Tax=Phaeosphaeria nodorum (strain SN15 / ATCC MYA-4574 / FGSC 10173) TaxID=321614 RepID=Q0UV53_PHANO|nr:hypothetical protein SNOG_04361 [Parastagonospora nodorum SN15]EAT88121.1 hypothetical protein SNOG_04361 [Parastagonospora nodorum SN15]
MANAIIDIPKKKIAIKRDSEVASDVKTKPMEEVKVVHAMDARVHAYNNNASLRTCMRARIRETRS